MFFKKAIINKVNELYFRNHQNSDLFKINSDLSNLDEFKSVLDTLDTYEFQDIKDLLIDLEKMTKDHNIRTIRTEFVYDLQTKYNLALERVENAFKAISLFSPVTIELFNIIDNNSTKDEKTYIVGGFLRDIISRNNYNDIDLCTNIEYDRLKIMLKEYGFKVTDDGKQFLVLNVYKDNEHFEIAALRSDKDNSGAKVGTIQEDAQRRDFVNSCLYFSITDYELIDPSGDAINDCLNNTLRFMGKPKDRINEDPLRVMRFYKFVKRGWEPEKRSLKAVRENFEEALRKTSATRVMNEIEKIVGLQ